MVYEIKSDACYGTVVMVKSVTQEFIALFNALSMGTEVFKLQKEPWQYRKTLFYIYFKSFEGT